MVSEMLQPPKRSLISKLVMREDDPSQIDWPALLTLFLYLAIMAGLLFGFFWAFTFWQDGWSPHGFN